MSRPEVSHLRVVPDADPAPLDDVRLLTIPAVADLLGLDERTIYTLIHAKTLRAVRPCGKYRVAVADLRAYVESMRRDPIVARDAIAADLGRDEEGGASYGRP